MCPSKKELGSPNMAVLHFVSLQNKRRKGHRSSAHSYGCQTRGLQVFYVFGFPRRRPSAGHYLYRLAESGWLQRKRQKTEEETVEGREFDKDHMCGLPNPWPVSFLFFLLFLGTPCLFSREADSWGFIEVFETEPWRRGLPRASNPNFTEALPRDSEGSLVIGDFLGRST